MTDKLIDPTDQATATEALFTEAALQVRKPTGPKATGRCLYCEEPLEPLMRWCDADCRSDWELTHLHD